MLKKFFEIFVEQSILFARELERDHLNDGNEIILAEHIENCTWKIACGKITFDVFISYSYVINKI